MKIAIFVFIFCLALMYILKFKPDQFSGLNSHVSWYFSVKLSTTEKANRIPVICSIKSVVDCPFVVEVIRVYPIKTGLSSGFCLLLSSNPFLLMQKLKVWDW